MAQQQVKFHSVSTSQYNDVQRPIDPGSLYFIDDNGEIRKGGKHVTGTRVFKAIDPSTGACSPVETLDIKIDGQSISKLVQKQTNDGEDLYLDADGNETTESTHIEGEGDDAQEVDNEKAMTLVPDTDVEQPKRGDMLVVDHEIAEGKHEFSAYIYAENGGKYDVSKWQACDGNVDASKVILTQKITMAGNYKNVGNLSKGDEGSKKDDFLEGGKTTEGVSVYELIKQMLQKTINPERKSLPSISKSSSYDKTGDQEAGTKVVATYTFGLTDGQFTYGDGTVHNAGCSVDTTGSVNGTGYNVTNGVLVKYDTVENLNAQVDAGTLTKEEDGYYQGEGDEKIKVADNDGNAIDKNGNTYCAKTGKFEFIAGTTPAKTITATANYTDSTVVPLNNFSQPVPDIKIDHSVTASDSIKLSVGSFRYIFWTTYSHAQLADIDSLTFTSDDVREGATFHWSKGKSLPTEVDWTGKQWLIVAAPNTTTYNKKKMTKIMLKSSDYTSNAAPADGISTIKLDDGTAKTVTIKGAGDDSGVAYCIWAFNLGSDGNEGLKITWN